MFFYWINRKKVLRVGMALLVVTLLFLENEMAKGKGMVVYAKEEPPTLYARAAVLYDADAGRILYEKDGEAFLANASTTKILTCIVALENGGMEDEVEISSYAAGMPKVKLFMRAGEHFILKDLLYSMMLESHNDSAVAIAEHIGGDVDSFMDMVNEKAKSIGCQNTCFLTPNGLDRTRAVTGTDGKTLEQSHGTTAADLAKIMAYCCFESEKAEEFLQITRCASYSFVNKEGRSFSCINHNAFLQMMEGALSGKTGFTNKAGYCYVGAYEKGEKHFTIALLACGWPNHKTYKWSDAKELFSYGEDNYEYVSFKGLPVKGEMLSPILVEEGRSTYLGEDAYVSVEIVGDIADCGMLLKPEEQVEIVKVADSFAVAPVKKGEVLGRIHYVVEGKIYATQEIVAQKEVKKVNFSWIFLKIIKKFLL